MKTLHIFLSLLLCLGLSAYSNVLKTEPQLYKVFINETDVSNKLTLKLFDDNSYEFIKLIKVKNKLSCKREVGEYILKGNKLSLTSKSSKAPFEHLDTYFVDEEKGLFESKKALKHSGEPLLSLSDDKKFNEEFYSDPVFGKVSNDKKVANKLADPKFNKKSETQVTNTPEQQVELIVEEKGIAYTPAKLSADSLKKIKVVIVVGPVEESTKGFIKEKQDLAKLLRGYGVQVKEFYDPKATWAEIQEGSKDANIFIYSGHGTTQGENSCSGGLCLSSGTISSTEMTAGLKLHKNALILFNHVCRGAGSSAGDDGDIGKVEAAKRVTDYSQPFIKQGAGCYYANNTNGALTPFLEKFFNKVPVSVIFKEATAGEKIVVKQKLGYDPRYTLSVACEDQSAYTITRTTTTNGVKKVEQIKGSISYDIAYVGIPDFTVMKFFEK